MYASSPENFGQVAWQLARTLEDWAEQNQRMLQELALACPPTPPQEEPDGDAVTYSSDEFSDSDCSQGSITDDEFTDSEDDIDHTDARHGFSDASYTSQATPSGVFHMRLRSSMYHRLTDIELGSE